MQGSNIVIDVVSFGETELNILLVQRRRRVGVGCFYRTLANAPCPIVFRSLYGPMMSGWEGSAGSHSGGLCSRSARLRLRGEVK